MSSTESNVGLVGYGVAGKVFHAPFIELAEGLRLHAVCSRTKVRREEACSDFPSVATYGSYEEMLCNESIDLIVLATPHDTHAPMAIQAMDAGKHLVTDKVMCMDEVEGRSMIEASKRNGVLLSVYQNRRWDGDFMTLQEVLRKGILGDILNIESNVNRLSGPSHGWRAWKRHGGGRTRDWGAHLIDQMLQIYGPTVKWVFADYEYRFPEAECDVESDSITWMEFENGVRFRMKLSNHEVIPGPRFEVTGSQGSFVKFGTDPQEVAIKLGSFGLPIPEDASRYQLKLRSPSGFQEIRVDPLPGTWQAYYKNIGQVLAGKAKLIVKPEESLEGVRILDAIRESASKNKVVKCS